MGGKEILASREGVKPTSISSLLHCVPCSELKLAAQKSQSPRCRIKRIFYHHLGRQRPAAGHFPIGEGGGSTFSLAEMAEKRPSLHRISFLHKDSPVLRVGSELNQTSAEPKRWETRQRLGPRAGSREGAGLADKWEEPRSLAPPPARFPESAAQSSASSECSRLCRKEEFHSPPFFTSGRSPRLQHGGPHVVASCGFYPRETDSRAVLS